MSYYIERVCEPQPFCRLLAYMSSHSDLDKILQTTADLQSQSLLDRFINTKNHAKTLELLNEAIHKALLLFNVCPLQSETMSE